MKKNPNPNILTICDKPCKNCLLGKSPIPAENRIKDILKECEEKQIPFLCHEFDERNEYVVCRSFYNQRKSTWLLFKLAKQLNALIFQPLKK
jgi:hypothetical protein